MGRIEAHSPVFEKMNLRKISEELVEAISTIFQDVYSNVEGGGETLNKLETFLQEYREDLQDPDLSLDSLKKINSDLRYFAQRLVSAMEIETGETPPTTGETEDFADLEGRRGEGVLRVWTKLSRQTPDTSALQELQRLSHLPSPSKINISKDIITSEFQTSGDILEIGSETDKQKISDLQKKGKLLFGSLEGLSGGTAFFKSFSFALAKILNEQSQYYNPDGGRKDRKGGYLLTGVPKDRIREVFGESAKLDKAVSLTINGESREFPYILLSYERLAREVSKTGKISGGKDIDFVRQYINGGYREFETDPKTGDRRPIKSSYTPGIASKKYPISNGRGGFIFVPFVVNEGEIVDTSRKDAEVGCILRLSPQYSKTLQGYTSLRGDTIQLIGGARQKDITMDLLPYLAHAINTTPELRKRKSDLLSKYMEKPTYKGRPGKLEEHFQEAVQKAIDAKILLPGKDKNGKLQGYREEKSPGGFVVCVFRFNPDYLKGETPTAPEDQPGGE